jgi:glucosamine-6-phosphate deaminase
MGVGTILEARSLILVAIGSSKSFVLAHAVEGPLTAMVPASAIQMHANTVILCDDAAAADLALADYYREAFPIT